MQQGAAGAAGAARCSTVQQVDVVRLWHGLRVRRAEAVRSDVWKKITKNVCRKKSWASRLGVF